MKDVKDKLSRRVSTALILVAVVIGLVVLVDPLAFSIILGFISALGGWEWCRLRNGKFDLFHDSLFVVLIAVGIPILFSITEAIPWILGIGVVWWLWCLIHLFLSSNSTSTKGWHAQWWKGVFVLLPGGVAICVVNNISSDAYWLTISCLILIWTSDTCAYFVGKKYGKRALASVISPSKTIEGFLAGIFGVILVAVLLFLALVRIIDIPFYYWLTLCLFTGVFSVVGDLTESAFKRAAGVKDSGNLIPGHGGVLDRIDSSLASFPIFASGLLLFLK